MKADKQRRKLEIVAKLMATENIVVEHRKVSTAAFNISQRKLILPVWKEMSEDLYSMLTAHEVAHALYTEKDVFMEKIVKPKDLRIKSVFNLLEDSRIEKLIQKKFPGLKQSFKVAYKDIFERDLLKTHGKDINKIKFLDRINIYYKLESHGLVKVNFSEKELEWIDLIDNCKTINQVIDLSHKLLKYLDEQQEEVPEDQDENNSEEKSSDEEGDPEEIQDSYDPAQSDTQDALDQAIKNLQDNNAKDPAYLNLGKFDLPKIVTNFKTVHKEIRSHYARYASEWSDAKKAFDEFKLKTFPTVSYMARLFEMKKRAKESSLIRVSKTGILNMNKIYSYQYNDDIFEKMTTALTGKSHGLIMYIDMSASMEGNMRGTIEQLICLVLFCRKVKIPFAVYGFNDIKSTGREYGIYPISDYHKSNLSEILIRKGFELREYFSSEMTQSELSLAFTNMMAVASFYATERGIERTCPPTERLGSTPLNETLFCATQMVSEFKNRNKIDIVNVVFLTDGEATGSLVYQSDEGYPRYVHEHELIYLYSKKKKKTYLLKSVEGGFMTNTDTTECLLKILKDVCDTNVIGFYISSSGLSHYVSNVMDKGSQSSTVKNAQKTFHENGVVELSNVGYDSYFIIKGGKSLRATGHEMSNDYRYKESISDDFLKYMQSKVGSKGILSKFIQIIA